MGLVHRKGDEAELLLLWWRCTLGVLHADSGLETLGLRTLKE